MGLQNPVLVAGEYAALPAIIPISVDANGFVNVNATFSGSISGNAAAGPTGSPVPADADYIGVNIGGNLVGVTGISLTNAKAATVAIVDGSGNQITSFGGGTQYADGVTQATPTGTVALGKNPSNILHSLSLDANGNLNVNLAADGFGTLTVQGTVTANQGGAPWSVTFPSAQPVTLASTTITGTVAVTQSTSPWVVSASGNFGVTQQTSPWVDNLTQVAGVALGSTAVVNYGSTPAAAPVPAINAFITNTPAVTLASTTITGTVAVTQSTNPWTVDVTDRAARLLGVIYGSQGQQLKQTATNFNTQVELATGGTLYDARQIRALTSADVVTVVQPTAANLNATVVFPSAQPVTLASTTITGTVGVMQSTSPWVDNITQIGGSAISLGAKASASSIPVVLATDEATLNVSVQNATLSVVQSSGANLHVNIDNFPATQPVSVIGTIPISISQATPGTTNGVVVNGLASVQDMSDGPVFPGFLAANASLIGAQIQNTGQMAALQQDIFGNLLVKQPATNLTSDTLQAILSQLKLLNLNIASSMPSAHVDSDTWLMDTLPTIQ